MPYVLCIAAALIVGAAAFLWWMASAFGKGMHELEECGSEDAA